MSPLPRAILHLFMWVIAASTSGCTYIGAAAAIMPPPSIEAQYANFAGQTVGVMVWADRSIRIDWPTLQIDLANSIQNKLGKQTAKGQMLAGATFPLSPQSMMRYQEDHPEAEFAPIESTAARLGVSRLVYVEVEEFTTRSDSAGLMYLGKIKATLKVVEVDGGRGNVVYEERDMNASFPPKAPPEGTIRGNDLIMYSGALEMLAIEVEKRFVPYESK